MADDPRNATKADTAIGDRIKQAREARGMPQAELGALIGVSFQQVQKYEKGKNRVGGTRLNAIAKALDVPLTELFGLSSRPPRQVKTIFGGDSIEPTALPLLRAYSKIKNQEVARTFVMLVERIVRSQK